MTTTLHKSAITGTLDRADQKSVGAILQETLVDMIDLSLVAKQAHWNIVGRQFRALHLQLDELVSAARGFTDEVAERASALGLSPDGRAATVASSTGLSEFPSGQIMDTNVVRQITECLLTLVKRLRRRVEATEKSDPVTQDLLIGITQELEKQHWMFEAQLIEH